MSRARLTIDLAALAHNHAALRAAAGPAEVAPVVKADGYGLGAGPTARRLWNEGARSFFVARLEEGEALRAALGGAKPATIFVLDGIAGDDVSRFAAAAVTPVLNSLAEISLWRTTSLPCALHVDTGMNRLGLGPHNLAAADGLNVVHLMSHLACAADPAHPRNPRQLALFRQARDLLPGVPASLSASAGIFLGPDYRFDVVRPGVSLFGGGPRERPDARIAAVATLEAPILQVRDLKAGDQVGYGDGFTAPGPTRVAILAGGYADGLLRRAKGQASAWLNGQRAPIVVVSMDLIAVDVSTCEGAEPGAWVELLGANALLDDLAAAAGTVAHECLVRLSQRARRDYAD